MHCSLTPACLFLSLCTSLVAAPLAAQDQAKPAARPAAAPSGPRPTEANVPYGTHPKQVVDFYKAESRTPTPVLVFIHGGGWMGGSKDRINAEPYLTAGISVVSVEYRFIPEATKDGVVPPVKGPLHDAARAIQFIRSKAGAWNLDKQRLAATGGSAGACTSLWLAFHDDLADPDSDDPLARESTRLLCAAVVGAQTTLDPRQMKEWTPNSRYGGHAFGFAADAEKKLSQFDVFLAGREKIVPWIKEYSPYELVSSDDPPVALYYSAPPAMGADQKDPTHTANFGVGLQERCKAAGVECDLIYPGASGVTHRQVSDYLIARLKPPK
jgi:acetyl esterase/lipase